MLDPFVDWCAALLAGALYAFASVESFVQGQAEQANIDVVAEPIVRHTPYLVAHDNASVVIDEVVAL